MKQKAQINSDNNESNKAQSSRFSLQHVKRGEAGVGGVNSEKAHTWAEPLS